MSEPAQKCENYAIFKEKYTLEMFIAFQMAYYCCFSLGGIYSRISTKKSFKTSTTDAGIKKWLNFFPKVLPKTVTAFFTLN